MEGAWKDNRRSGSGSGSRSGAGPAQAEPSKHKTSVESVGAWPSRKIDIEIVLTKHVRLGKMECRNTDIANANICALDNGSVQILVSMI